MMSGDRAKPRDLEPNVRGIDRTLLKTSLDVPVTPVDWSGVFTPAIGAIKYAGQTRFPNLLRSDLSNLASHSKWRTAPAGDHHIEPLVLAPGRI